ncbi:cyclic nucleotide-binding domain-containing protein [Verrucomicrobiales bacterium]|nr:cyclic nucleotide-binding domain-containing protein [Verrucomicrobiales bacterium]
MLSHAEKKSILQSVEMFSEASASILEKLSEIVEEVTFEKGQELTSQGIRCPNLYVLASGSIGIYIREGEGEREAAILSDPGKVVGEIGAVSGLVATATVRAVSDEAHFLQLEGERFNKIISAEPQVATTVLRSLARYLKANS